MLASNLSKQKVNSLPTPVENRRSLFKNVFSYFFSVKKNKKFLKNIELLTTVNFKKHPPNPPCFTVESKNLWTQLFFVMCPMVVPSPFVTLPKTKTKCKLKGFSVASSRCGRISL